MKLTGIIMVAVVIVLLGVFDTVKFKKNTKLIEEILQLISLFKREIGYRKMRFSHLLDKCKDENFKNIHFTNNDVLLPDFANERIKQEFNLFLKKIGTTDEAGQIDICDSYIQFFSELLREQKCKEQSRLQVNLSLSILGALSIVIIFI